MHFHSISFVVGQGWGVIISQELGPYYVLYLRVRMDLGSTALTGVSTLRPESLLLDVFYPHTQESLTLNPALLYQSFMLSSASL